MNRRGFFATSVGVYFASKLGVADQVFPISEGNILRFDLEEVIFYTPTVSPLYSLKEKPDARR